jgi:phosphocarrier protein FPr/phosphocarrier protein
VNSKRLVGQFVFPKHPGLNAPAAALIAKCASQFDSDIMLSCAGHRTNAKSILGLMTLAVKHGNVVTVEVEGGDCSEAMIAMDGLFHSSFALFGAAPARKIPGAVSETRRTYANVG